MIRIITQQNPFCKHCGSFDFEERSHETHGAGAWCNNCGRFIKWLGKTRTPEQQAERQARKQMYIREHMAGQDATDKQMDYLGKLGFKGYVGSRLHAHNLIDNMAGDNK